MSCKRHGDEDWRMYGSRVRCVVCIKENQVRINERRREANKARKAEREAQHNWYDWVVVYRILTGRDPGRPPTRAERERLAELQPWRNGRGWDQQWAERMDHPIFTSHPF